MSNSAPSDLGSGVAVFDVCETLYFSNTTHDFVKFVVSRGRRGKLRHSILNSKSLPLRYALIAVSRYFGWDPLRSYNVGLLRGYSSQELKDLADRFVAEFLREKKVPAVHEMLENEKAREKTVVLCSTSIEPVVEAIAKELNIDQILCSRLEYDNDVCAGRIIEDLGSFKLERLKTYGFTGAIDLAVSDNLGDLNLLKAARRGIAVVHTNRKESFWRLHDMEILRPER